MLWYNLNVSLITYGNSQIITIGWKLHEVLSVKLPNYKNFKRIMYTLKGLSCFISGKVINLCDIDKKLCDIDKRVTKILYDCYQYNYTVKRGNYGHFKMFLLCPSHNFF